MCDCFSNHFSKGFAARLVWICIKWEFVSHADRLALCNSKNTRFHLMQSPTRRVVKLPRSTNEMNRLVVQLQFIVSSVHVPKFCPIPRFKAKSNVQCGRIVGGIISQLCDTFCVLCLPHLLHAPRFALNC